MRAGYDALRDEGEAYTRKLWKPAIWRQYGGILAPFRDSSPCRVRYVAHQAFGEVSEFLKFRLHTI
jgi:hypothetical protein